MTKEMFCYIAMVLLAGLALVYPAVDFYRVVLAIYVGAVLGIMWLAIVGLFFANLFADKPLNYKPGAKPMSTRPLQSWAVLIAKLLLMTWLLDSLGWHNTAGAYFVGVLAFIAILFHMEQKHGFKVQGE